MLYNIPARTGANLEPATVLRLAEIPNVMGIKESSGNMTQITELLTTARRRGSGCLRGMTGWRCRCWRWVGRG